MKPSKDDLAFGRAAVAFGFINSNQLATFIQQHMQAQRTGQESSMRHLMVKSGIINASQISIIEKQSFGRYKILKEIGRGGMGCVYKAFDPELNRTVALKRLLSGSSQEGVDRFIREAKATARLKHPHIIMVYDIGNEEGENFFAMDYIEGLSLRDHIKKKHPSIRHSAEMLVKVCNAIHYAHEQGIIHRDLKPANVMIDPKNDPIVMDFGLAKVTQVSKDLSRSGMILGTLEYMPPEQAEGRRRAIDARSDVYSLGAILYEMLAGVPPFKGTSLSNMLSQIMNEDPIPPSEVKSRTPKTLENICLKALAKKKEHRYKSAAAMAHDLSRFAKGETIKVRKMSLKDSVLKNIKQNQLWVSLGVCAIVLVIGGIVASTKLAEKDQRIRGLLKKQKESPKKAPVNQTQNTKRIEKIMEEIASNIPIEIKRERVLEIVRMKNEHTTRKCLSYLKDNKGNQQQQLFAIEVLGKLGDTKTKENGKNVIEHLEQNLSKLRSGIEDAHIEATIWAFGRLRAVKTRAQVVKLYESRPSGHPLLSSTFVPFNWLSGQKMTPEMFEKASLKLDKRDSSFVLIPKAKDNIRIEFIVNYSKPGKILDSIGLYGSPPGAIIVDISNNNLVLRVYNRALKGPFQEGNGWNGIVVGNFYPNVDNHVVVEARSGNYTLTLNKNFSKKMDIATPLKDIPVYIGDFPQDNQMKFETRWSTFRGTVKVLYVGDIDGLKYQE